ncbi:MAG: hypothetical protein HXS53_11175 [Theionarchaea archaeon]|nr:hypothetical protein [Theionarchaea archaeon]
MSLDEVCLEHLSGIIGDWSSHILAVEVAADSIDALPIDACREFSVKVIFWYEFFIYEW